MANSNFLQTLFNIFGNIDNKMDNIGKRLPSDNPVVNKDYFNKFNDQELRKKVEQEYEKMKRK